METKLEPPVYDPDPLSGTPLLTDSLLDYFAVKAMQGMLSGHFAHYGHDDYWKRDAIAEEAYEMAEAMMAERQRRLK